MAYSVPIIWTCHHIWGYMYSCIHAAMHYGPSNLGVNFGAKLIQGCCMWFQIIQTAVDPDTRKHFLGGKWCNSHTHTVYICVYIFTKKVYIYIHIHIYYTCIGFHSFHVNFHVHFHSIPYIHMGMGSNLSYHILGDYIISIYQLFWYSPW